MKRLVTIQDISCFGKCSQTVALPIISALGIETVMLPTALLSTHTGEFTDYSYLSLCDEIPSIIAHWKKENICFDAIYVGYIGSVSAVKMICDFIDDFSTENTVIFVDPAMADNAKLYDGFDMKYVGAIKELCKKAHIISPNVYEAMLLTSGECLANYSLDDVDDVANKLSKLCPKSVITGIHCGDEMISYGIDKETEIAIAKKNTKIDGMFYGTGDVFASTFIGAYINGIDFEKSISLADDFVQLCISKTLSERDKYWYGINFEPCLSFLTDFYKENCSK